MFIRCALGADGTLAWYVYDDLGHRVAMGRPSGAHQFWAYGAGNVGAWATNMTQVASGGAGQVDLSYETNPAGQIVRRTSDNDNYGWTQFARAGRSYAVNALNQYSGVGGQGLGYDARGNLTSSGGAGYGYSARNLLVSSPGDGFYYDALGRLDMEDEGRTLYLYAGSSLIMEKDYSHPDQGLPTTRRYVYGAGGEPIVWYEGPGVGDKRWLAGDERGSIMAVLDGSGIATANHYDEFGVPQSTNVGRFGFTGQMWMPNIAMYHYKARTYSPTLGRFLQTDPIGYADGVNWYNYAHGDPVNNTDPSGLAVPVGTSGQDAAAQVPVSNVFGKILVSPSLISFITMLDPGLGASISLPNVPSLSTAKAASTEDQKEIVVTACNAACRLNRAELYRITNNNLFICGGFSVGIGGGACYGGGQGFLYGSAGTPGLELVAGYAPGGAANYLTGSSVGATGLPGAGLSPSPFHPTANAWLVGLPSASASYGVSFGTISIAIGRVGSSFGSAFGTLSNGFYNMAGRPYDFGR